VYHPENNKNKNGYLNTDNGPHPAEQSSSDLPLFVDDNYPE